MLPRLSKALPLLFIGSFLYALIWQRQVNWYTSGRLEPLVLVTSLLALLMAWGAFRPNRPVITLPLWSLTLFLIPAGWAWFFPAPPSAELALAYLGWDEAEQQQLFRVNYPSQEVQQLTFGSGRVLDFAPAPDGQLIAYTLQTEDGSTNIWTIDPAGRLPYQLLNCLGASCSQPTWYPDGSRLIYERRRIPEPGLAPVEPRLWWLDALTGDTLPLFADETVQGYGASFSPDGQWVAYLLPGQEQLQLYNLQTNSGFTVRSGSGERGVWHPSSQLFYYTDVEINQGSIALHIYGVDLQKPLPNETDLTGVGLQFDDGGLAMSPDGAWLLLTRKPTGTGNGKQVWVIPPAGGAGQPLTAEPDIQHAQLRWSPEGQWVVLQRFNTTRPDSSPTLWLLEWPTKLLRPVGVEGIHPQWLRPGN